MSLFSKPAFDRPDSRIVTLPPKGTPTVTLEPTAIKHPVAGVVPGKKYDGGKGRYDLIPPLGLDEFVKVLTFGAQKYDDNNWKVVPHAKKRYFAALNRHIWALKRGETHDKESGLHHYAHAMCCLAFLMEFELDPAANDLQTKASTSTTS